MANNLGSLLGTALGGGAGFFLGGPMGALAGAGLGGSLGGMFGGGGSSSGPRFLQSSPAGNTLGQLFGQSFLRSKGYVNNPGLANQPFSMDTISPLISNIINNPLISSSSMGDIGSLFNNSLPGTISNSMSNLGALSNMGMIGAATGFGNSAQPAFQEAIRRFGADILPQIAETSGLGLQSSGFGNIAGREGANLLGQAALSQIDLNEAASNRMMQLLPISAALQSGAAAFPLNISQQLEQQRQTPFNMFLSAAGMPTPLIQQGYPTQDPTSDIFGSLGGLAGLLKTLGVGGGAGAGGV